MSFKIPAIPPTTNKTIRFPNDVIEQVESAISVIAAVRDALEQLQEEADK